MALTKENSKRIRISVPLNDELVLEWLDNQYSLSLSIRSLIKDHVQRYGLEDYFASNMEDIKGTKIMPKETVVEEVREEVKIEQPKTEVIDEVVEKEKAVEETNEVRDRIAMLQGLMNK